MLKLRRLQIDQYRNVRPCELRFNEGFNIVLGLNGTGKTTLLSLLSDLLRWHIGAISDGEPFRLRLDVTQDGRDQSLGLYQPITEAQELDHRRHSELIRDSRIRFSEGLETLAELEAGEWGSLEDTKSQVLRVIPSPGNPSFILSAVGPPLERALRAQSARDRVVLSAEDLPLLGEVARIEGFAAVSLHIERIEKVPVGHQRWLHRYGRPRFYITRKDGSELYHDRLSRGQKRLLAFLYYLEANPDIVIADELVNDLHHAWIQHCVERIGNRQAFLTSQNPLLFDHLTFDSAEQVARSFVLCSTVSGSVISESEDLAQSEELIWRNPSEEEAESFFRAYQAGVLHVSEILRSKGLW